MAPRSAGSRRLRPMAGILILLSVLGISLFLWIQRMEAVGWARMESRVLDLTQQAQNRRRERPVWRGQPSPGNGWDEYLLAFKEADKARGTASPPSGPPRQQIEQLLASRGPMIDHLRKGTRCREVAPPLSSDPRKRRLLPRPPTWDVLWQAMVGYARLLAADGRHQEAVECLDDLYLFGCDLSWNVTDDIQAAGLVIRQHALDELRALVVDPQLPRECLQALQTELETLDRATPHRGAVLLNDTAQLGKNFLSESSWEDSLKLAGEDAPTFDWRHLFSKRLLALDMFHRVDEWNHRAAGAEELPWVEALKVHESIHRDAHPDFWSLGLRCYAWAAWSRALHAKLRLLRTAVHFRQTGEVLLLDDPLGTRLMHTRSAPDRLKAWSQGAFDQGEPEKSPWADPAGKHHLAIEVDR